MEEERPLAGENNPVIEVKIHRFPVRAEPVCKQIGIDDDASGPDELPQSR